MGIRFGISYIASFLRILFQSTQLQPPDSDPFLVSVGASTTGIIKTVWPGSVLSASHFNNTSCKLLLLKLRYFNNFFRPHHRYQSQDLVKNTKYYFVLLRKLTRRSEKSVKFGSVKNIPLQKYPGRFSVSYLSLRLSLVSLVPGKRPVSQLLLIELRLTRQRTVK